MPRANSKLARTIGLRASSNEAGAFQKIQTQQNLKSCALRSVGNQLPTDPTANNGVSRFVVGCWMVCLVCGLLIRFLVPFLRYQRCIVNVSQTTTRVTIIVLTEYQKDYQEDPLTTPHE